MNLKCHIHATNMNTVQTAQVNTLIADLKPGFPEGGFMGPSMGVGAEVQRIYRF